MLPAARRTLPTAKFVLGLALLVWAGWFLAGAMSNEELARVARALGENPLPLLAAVAAYALAFGLRTWAWVRVLPTLPAPHAWAALHVSLLGNHVLPLRLGEALRPASVARRTTVSWQDATASTLALRTVDLLAVVALAAAAAPALLREVAGGVLPVIGAAALVVVLGGTAVWARRAGLVTRLPGPAVVLVAALAWALEAAVVLAVADAAGVPLTAAEAVAVTAVTMAAQVVALTPGGLGTYEAAATAALVATGADAGTAFAVALTTHAVKTAYSLVLGGTALIFPAPSFFGRLRLSRRVPDRPLALAVAADAPVVVMIPVFDEEDAVGDVVRRVPRQVAGRAVEVLVVDDGSTDRSAERAAAAGARVVPQERNLGLGAAVRRGLAEACARGPAAVVYLDADREYFPEDIERVVAPVLSGTADYVVGSRWRGDVQRVLAHRRFGNRVLTWWVRWLTRRRDLTDGQSGFRAFSAAAAADGEVIHDYNYAQVLTLDLLAKGYTYAEVPIAYRFRESGASFVKLGRYLRAVVPAVHRELQSPSTAQTSDAWTRNVAARSPARHAGSMLADPPVPA